MSPTSPLAPAAQSMLGQPQQPSTGDVMPAMKQESGEGGGKKKPSQIIRDYVIATTGDQKAADYVLAVIGKQVQKKVARIIQFGNTVFWAQQKGPGTVDVHIFTEERPQALAKRMKQAYEWAKSKGFKTITSTLTDMGTANLLKASGLPVNLSQTTINDGQKMVPAYQLTMEVK